MAKAKNPKPKARLPRGFIDRSADNVRETAAMTDKIRAVFENYGFDPIETPMFEYTDALGKFLPDSDRPNEGVFSLTDDDDQWMSLRYDLTAPLARHVAENLNSIQLPYRTFRAGYVFRNEKPGPGRYRQFMQFDADSVGAPSVSADAEMCMMMADTMESLGIKRGDYVIRVFSRKVLDGMLDFLDVDGETRLTVLRAIDKFDKFGTDGVRLLLGAGRKDDSGDFTKGAGLDPQQVDAIVGRLEVSGDGDNRQTIASLREIFGSNTIAEDGLSELQVMDELFQAAEYGSDRIKIDPSCVRGLEYYTGPVYEAELLFAVTNEKGQQVQFGSVGGGGRYDGLVARFTGQPVPATGFSIGVSRLMAALTNLGRLSGVQIEAPVIVCVMDRDTASLARYQGFTQALRTAGIRAEMYQGNPKNFGKQLQYADRRDSPCVIIQGSDERDKGVVQIKDLREGKLLAQGITDNEAWREARVAQSETPEDGLVPAVQAILARYRVEQT
jgi:histidyl-tRNA synthetase